MDNDDSGLPIADVEVPGWYRLGDSNEIESLAYFNGVNWYMAGNNRPYSAAHFGCIKVKGLSDENA